MYIVQYIIYYYTCILQLDGIKHDKEPKYIADMGGPSYIWDLCVRFVNLLIDIWPWSKAGGVGVGVGQHLSL